MDKRQQDFKKTRNQPWYAVRCLFYDDNNKSYEERTTLFKAASHDEAIKKAEAEAVEYCSALLTSTEESKV